MRKTGLAADGAGFIAIGDEAKGLYFSADGHDWERLAAPFGGVGISDVAGSPLGFVAVTGRAGHDLDREVTIDSKDVWFSSDGKEWKRADKGPHLAPCCPQVAGNKLGFIAVSPSDEDTDSEDEQYSIWFSPDGLVWSLVHKWVQPTAFSADDAGVSGRVSAAAYADHFLVDSESHCESARLEGCPPGAGATLSQEQHWISGDGFSWTASPPPPPGLVLDVASAPARYLVFAP